MSISPILLNGSIQQTDNVLHNQVKHAEKGAVDQGNITVQSEKQEQAKARRVANTEESFMKRKKHDAKEKGSNEYTGDGGKNRRNTNGTAKAVNGFTGGFDMKI
jgi:hypothetical protein